ncbi:MAG: glycosyltransferase family 9 protein [Candidatus Cloacimonas sp.]|jgi:ADP-heptose:LPS heptosyltransferase|nr:glycosyltransferase family 9 protein [Candidatus Cloacimonas sp.]
MGTTAKKQVILISRTDRLGDLLLSFPAIRKVRELFPEARIIVLIRRYTADLLYGQSFIDRVICLEDFPLPELIQEIRQEKLDFFIALFTNELVGKIARASGAKYRIGPLSKLHSWFTYNKGIRQKRSHALKNEAEYNLDLLKRLPQTEVTDSLYTKLYYGDEHAQYVNTWLESKSITERQKVVLINPFSGGSAKNLTLQQYLALGMFISAAVPEAHIVYTVVAQDRYQAIIPALSAHQSLFINDGSILYLIALMDRASLYIGASTGPTHLAAFMHAAVVAVYPRILNQSPIRWGLLGSDKITYIQPDVPCPQKFGCKRSCRYYDCFHSLNISHIAEVCQGYLK